MILFEYQNICVLFPKMTARKNPLPTNKTGGVVTRTNLTFLRLETSHHQYRCRRWPNLTGIKVVVPRLNVTLERGCVFRIIMKLIVEKILFPQNKNRHFYIIATTAGVLVLISLHVLSIGAPTPLSIRRTKKCRQWKLLALNQILLRDMHRQLTVHQFVPWGNYPHRHVPCDDFHPPPKVKTTIRTSTRTIYHHIAVGSYLQPTTKHNAPIPHEHTHTHTQASTHASTSGIERTRRQREEPKRYRILPPSMEDKGKSKDDGMHRSSLFFAFANQSRYTHKQTHY